MSDIKRHLSEDEHTPTIRKRKYRKHPKPDLNAPKKPSPSAYHLFALIQGEELRKKGYGFEDIAKETGAMWRSLSPQAVNELEAKTTQAKNQYRKDMAAYKKSTEYKAYQDYLKRWMAKEEMKKKHQNRPQHAQEVIKPPSPVTHSSPLATTSNTPSPVSTGSASVEDMPALDWTGSISSQSSLESDYFATIPNEWFTMPETSAEPQVDWKWPAEYVTLAPDPLFPLRTESPKTMDTFTMPDMISGSMTISPTMLDASNGWYF